VAPEIAALAEPLAVALHAIRRAAPRPNDAILVAGAGPVGGLCCLVLKHLGFGPVLFAERQPARRKLVAEVTGAASVDLDAEAIATASGGKPIAAAIEATGVNAVLERLVELVGPGARIALVGIPHGKASLSTIALVEREIELKGCSAFRDELPEAVAMLAELAPKLAHLVEAPIGLDAVPAAYERLIAGGSAALKTIIRP